MRNKFIKMTMVICMTTVVLTFSACGSGKESANGNGNNLSYEELQKQYEELQKQYDDLTGYTMLLEDKMVQLDGEVRTLIEQNDILKSKLSGQQED